MWNHRIFWIFSVLYTLFPPIGQWTIGRWSRNRRGRHLALARTLRQSIPKLLPPLSFVQCRLIWKSPYMEGNFPNSWRVGLGCPGLPPCLASQKVGLHQTHFVARSWLTVVKKKNFLKRIELPSWRNVGATSEIPKVQVATWILFHKTRAQVAKHFHSTFVHVYTRHTYLREEGKKDE